MDASAAGSGKLVAGIELGGTKCIALLARGMEIVQSARIPTTTPEETLSKAARHFEQWRADIGEPAALGIASFGPLGLDKGRTDYGHITKTPKQGWADSDIVGYFANRMGMPIGFDTDVTGAALAEYRWGAAQDCDVAVYLTVGTGIGGGAIVNGRPVHGLVHPEIGHVRVRRRAGDDFPGTCPFHGDCIEGLAAGPAITRRAGKAGDAITADDPVWTDVTLEMAELMATLILTLSPRRIIIGGGVFQGQRQLFRPLRARTAELLARYVARIDAAALDQLIVPPALGDRAGPLGAVALALDALRIA